MWSTADLVILIPLLGRPHRVEPVLTSAQEATPGARILFLTTPTDVEVRATVDDLGAERLDVPWKGFGDYARKINTGYRHTTEPLMFLGADDLHFHDGWFDKVTAKLAAGIGVVGTVDLSNRRTRRGEHSTHSLVTRAYADQGTIDGPGILHEGYPHEYVDDELVATAQHRNAYTHSRAVVEHLHPMVGKAPMDAMYQAQAQRMRVGRAIYHRRRHLWT